MHLISFHAYNDSGGLLLSLMKQASYVAIGSVELGFQARSHTPGSLLPPLLGAPAAAPEAVSALWWEEPGDLVQIQ